MATEQEDVKNEIQKWCEENELGNISDGLQEFIESLQDLEYADDGDINEIIKALALPLKVK